jgi:hypothetical protein
MSSIFFPKNQGKNRAFFMPNFCPFLASKPQYIVVKAPYLLP